MTEIGPLLASRGIRTDVRPNATLAFRRDEAEWLLDALLRPTTRTYLEWGSGGSTELVGHLILNGAVPPSFHAISIESSTKWMTRLRTGSPSLVRAVERGRVQYEHGDMGETGVLGYPLRFDPADRARALGYVSLETRMGGRTADVVLVDGRFRLACAVEALAHLSRWRGDDAPLVLMHDYVPEHRVRATYVRAQELYDLQHTNGTLATLTPKRRLAPSVDVAALFAEALRHPE